MTNTSFKNLLFGYASAEKEREEHPSLLLEGYMDTEGIVDAVRSGSKFLVLGYKGSGKSAIRERLELLAEDRSDLFVTSTFLSDFPYAEFRKMIPGDDDVQAHLPSAWSWLLLLTLLGSFARDEGSNIRHERGLSDLVRQLTDLGLLNSQDLARLVVASRKRDVSLSGFGIELKGRFETGVVTAPPLSVLVDRVRHTISLFRSDSQHLLVIDGLDDILLGDQVQYETLAALVNVVARLNAGFAAENISIKILLVCRTDLFERLPSANKNKLRQDSAIQLDWYDNPREVSSNRLLNLANLRASLSSQRQVDVFEEYFPYPIHDSKEFVLSQTRHTPRDFVQVLRHIQRFDQGGRLTQAEMLSGTRSYSIDYFLPEIVDECVGYIGQDDARSALDLIGSLSKRQFRYRDLEARAKGEQRFRSLDLPSILNVLFECSFVGYVQRRPTGTFHYTFRYRNRNSRLNLDAELTLHKGAWKALNLV